MIKLEFVRAFVAVAEARSLTDAARQLAISKSVISERLTELERTLGSKLVRRTTRQLGLTDDGKIFHERAKRILVEVDAAASELAERRGALSGPLRISAPVSFGSLHLGSALFGFLAEHPAIELTLELDDRFVDILAGGYDAVIRHGPVKDDRIIIKRLAASRRLLVASASYLKRFPAPTTVRALASHRGIIYANRGTLDWRFKVGRKFEVAQPHVALRVNNGVLMRDAAIAGLGIALLPTFLLQAPFKGRTLKVIEVGAEAESATIYIAYPEHHRSSAKIRALTSWLKRSFGDPPRWDEAP